MNLSDFNYRSNDIANARWQQGWTNIEALGELECELPLDPCRCEDDLGIQP